MSDLEIYEILEKRYVGQTLWTHVKIREDTVDKTKTLKNLSIEESIDPLVKKGHYLFKREINWIALEGQRTFWLWIIDVSQAILLLEENQRTSRHHRQKRKHHLEI